MTKTITKTTLAILALGLAAPAMAATDGNVGPASQGTMNVEITINATDQLQVYGLEDIGFGTVANIVPFSIQLAGFCVTRNTAGNIRLTLDSATTPGSLALQRQNVMPASIPVSVQIWRPGGSASTDSFSSGGGYLDSPPSPSTCNAQSNNFTGDGFGIGVTPQESSTPYPDGTYNNVYTLTATPL